MRSDFLRLAERIGHELADAAIWCDGRCTWVGARPSDAARRAGGPALSALGPDLYDGTSGVALFLAEAAAELGDERLARTARGALRHALAQAGGSDPRCAGGLYGGDIGIAYAATRVAHRLGSKELVGRAPELLGAWRRPPAGPDVMSGCAGAIVGLVALGHAAAAARLGDELIGRADVAPAGWSWAAPGQRANHNLCGYAHGAAGIGHAFAELFGATGAPRFRTAALRAFDYERSWLDARRGSWPDLRGVGRRAARDAPVPAAVSWCNGTPGIALSRLRAAALLGAPAPRADAEIALRACVRHAERIVARAPDDFSLCHGAAGVADALLDAGAPEPAVALGRRGAELYAGARFPSGVPAGDTPALLLGSSGVGMLYLRLAGAPVPTPLLVRAVDTASGARLESDPPGKGGCRAAQTHSIA